MHKRGDSFSAQLYEACQQKRTAAQILDYFMASHENKRKKYPSEPADSPMLWMDFSQVYLAKKFMVSEKTIVRHLRYLEKRDFILSFHTRGCDRTKRYQLNRALVETITQKLELWEAVGVSPIDCESDDTSTDKMSECIPTKCPVATRQNVRMHSDKMSGCTYPLSPLSYSLSSPSGEFADAAIQTEAEASQATVEVLSDAPVPVLDTERESLIEQCRVVGIAQEHTEAILTDHSRQKLQAALECLHAKARYGVVKNQGGFVIGFLKFPVKYGYELDSQGCWRPSREIARAEKLRRAAIKARDRPAEDAEVSRHRAARRAWEECDEPTKQQIQALIDQQNPTLYAAAKTALCWREALERTHIRES